MRSVSDPGLYQPELTRSARAWRLGGCIIISVFSWMVAAESGWHPDHARMWIDFAVGLGSYFVVRKRRDHPFGVALTLAAMTAASSIAVGPATLGIVSLATRRESRRILIAGAAMVAAMVVYAAIHPGGHTGVVITTGTGDTADVAQKTPPLLDLGGKFLWNGIALGLGMYFGSRRELLWALHERAHAAEAEQEAREEASRSAERTRIAREMHDVLAHRISRVSMHAGALAYREDLNADELRSQIATIQEQANAALTDLRNVLGVLRAASAEEGAPPKETPQPMYADVPALISEAITAGMRVEFEDHVTDPEVIPPNPGRAMYRIIQEALTNASKHAPGALVQIEVDQVTEDGVAGMAVTVSNRLGFGGPTVPGSRLGLVGLAERATLRGGHLRHGVENGYFVVRGWIPWSS